MHNTKHVQNIFTLYGKLLGDKKYTYYVNMQLSFI
jgi:hypothetical protein